MTLKPIFNGIALLLCVLIPGIALSQQVAESLILNLQNSPTEGVVISPSKLEHRIVSLPKEYNCSPGYHHYLWFKKKLVIQVDGSGKLYEIGTTKPAMRMDNTCFEGYNYHAFNFVYRDSLFSLGGYGYWVNNGMLRCYDDKNRVWFVTPTNKVLPFEGHTAQFYYDVADKKIYLIYLTPTNLWEEKSVVKDNNQYVQCLDLQTKRWWTEPRLFNNANVKRMYPSLTYRAGFHTKQGLLIDNELEYLLYDFKNNLCKQIEPAKQILIFNSNAKFFEKLLFCKDSSLIFLNSLTGSIDSIPFGDADLVATKFSIYLPLPKKEKAPMDSSVALSISVLSVLLLLGGWIVYRYKKMRLKIEMLTLGISANIDAKQGNGISIQHPNSFKANLTETENKLLELLVNNGLQELMTSVNQMNEVLGLGKKPIKIQNNLRAAAVQMINKKFMVFSGIQDELLKKQRTAFDKRFFEYTIQRKYLSKVK